MKKLSTVKRNKLSKGLFSRIPMCMRITPFLLAGFLMQANAENIYSQSAVISIEMNNATVEEVLNEIEMNSDYHFLYNNQLIDVDRKVSVKADADNIEAVLHNLFDGTNVAYKIVNKQIVLSATDKDLSENIKMSEGVNDERTWTIQGQVMENSEPPYPLAGVNITIKGTSIGTISDENGYFSIKAKRGDILIFQFIGFKNHEFVVSRAISNLTVPLSSDAEELEEVVVTGISEERRINSVSAVSTLDITKNLATKPITSLSQSLQGGITGLNVTQSSGLPGADAATIKIRGISSIKTNNDPLVLVDGIPMDMNQLDPNTIESVTVLKDAAAAAIYGARAANGVIVVKTKRGMPGKVNISYNGYVGIQQATCLPEFVDAATYMEMANVANKNIGGDPTYSQEAIDATRNHLDPIKYPDTDWMDYMFKNGLIHSHSLAVSGGSNLARFALTVNYLQNEGLIEKAKSDRFNIRANTSVNLLENLSVNMDFNSYRTNRYEPLYSDENTRDILYFAYRTPPTVIPIYPMKEGSDITYYGNRPEQRNPAAMIDRGGNYKALEDNISINISPRWVFIPNLILRGQYSYRISSSATTSQRKSYNFFDYETDTFLQTWDAINSATQGRSSYYYLGGTLEYTLEKNKHRLFVIGGYNQELTNSGTWDQWAMVSMFAKANYTFNNRYLLEGTVRRDGSSRFGKGHKYGVFPSIGAGWNVHEENFMKNVNFVNSLKIRGSFGTLGNENVGLYKYQNLINSSNGTETFFGNPNLTWETVQMFNIGADITLFKDLDITIDYYNKLTKDLILEPPISFIGGTQKTLLNAGRLQNKGWEIDLNYNKQVTKDFGFNIHGGMSHNKNEIKELFGGPYDNSNTINKEGYALNSFYTYPTDGLLQEDDFIKDQAGNLVPKDGVVIFDGQKPGDIHYLDTNGDDKITADDRVIRGDDQPKLNYFANVTLNWKKWSFEVLFQGVSGVDAYYSQPYSFGLDLTGDGFTPLAVQTDYWTPENTDARYPRLAPNATYGNNAHQSDFWHFDAGYCRVKYMQLGYTFDQMGLKRIGISSIRLYVNAQNPFTFSKEDLVDPESRGQLGAYPLVKTYSFGVNVNF